MAQSYNLQETYPCTKCGQQIPGVTLYKRQTRGSDNTLCVDCNAVPLTKIQATGCTPWTGDFDWDTMTPLKNGKPYKAGIRGCGNADCVNRNHILPVSESSRELIAEQFSVVYRTGIFRSYDELVADLKKEKGKVNV